MSNRNKRMNLRSVSFKSKPIEPTPSNLKADLAVFVNSNMLVTNIIGKNAQGLCVSSTPASKFEFLELPDRHG